MKSHNISIDILKFFAALLITNSHMELLYGKYSMLATGGSIGDVLFFFASGFTHSWRGMVRYLHNDVLHHFMDYQTNNRKQVRMGICRCFGSSVG